MKDLIDKYLNDSINGVELERLKVWLLKKKNQDQFKAILENHYYINLGLQEVDLETEYSMLLKKIEGKTISNKRSYARWYKGAAIFIGLMGLGYMVYLTTKNDKEILFDENSITIIQENGNTQVIKEDGSVEIVDKNGKTIGRQNGTQLDYKNVVSGNRDQLQDEVLTYNELVVPYGKRMKLILSDSSIVHINSGTRLKYPVKFLKNKDRKVFLEGEAFFEVSKSKTASFIVNADNIDIRVLGTKFNVLCTPGNDVESTTAMAGSGANVILFTTGLGTPTGNPVTPVVKVSSNTELKNKMPDIIDVDTGLIITGEKNIDEMADELLNYIVEVASGRIQTKAMLLNQNDFIPWKRGVSL